ncbi:MAG: hypothetical protein UT66_C0014G0020 [candidate division CPR2 bacterium GW2011_GWC1_39_9]|uniref:Uncharacterized protein n=1 Tax=candidate division CPR2 bacterium GW2011_GWC2_39_10 TaxID=1618345 RepID=A0A0G0M4J2_UNCC2|nr:MAG: hypothetical protein UT18_C0002G0017 [candidate division CPR2 bacterium GW2011_GWC2_39_10]KKR34945.1 MAG: hypothetical protein UT66_C0014G0020 [candidate division CPR2 bacterium GW2011_GWC1_39_9]
MNAEQIVKLFSYFGNLFKFWLPLAALILISIEIYLFVKKKEKLRIKYIYLILGFVLIFSLIDTLYWMFFQYYLYKLPGNFFGAEAIKNPAYLKVVALNIFQSRFLMSFISSASLTAALYFIYRFRPGIMSKEELSLFFVISFFVGWEYAGYYLGSAFIAMIGSHIYMKYRKVAVGRISIYPYLLFISIPFLAYNFYLLLT